MLAPHGHPAEHDAWRPSLQLSITTSVPIAARLSPRESS